MSEYEYPHRHRVIVCCGDIIEFRRFGGLGAVVFHNGDEQGRLTFTSTSDLDAEASRLLLYAMRMGAMFVLDEHGTDHDAHFASRYLHRAFMLAGADQARRNAASGGDEP